MPAEATRESTTKPDVRNSFEYPVKRPLGSPGFPLCYYDGPRSNPQRNAAERFISGAIVGGSGQRNVESASGSRDNDRSAVRQQGSADGGPAPIQQFPIERARYGPAERDQVSKDSNGPDAVLSGGHDAAGRVRRQPWLIRHRIDTVGDIGGRHIRPQEADVVHDGGIAGSAEHGRKDFSVAPSDEALSLALRTCHRGEVRVN